MENNITVGEQLSFIDIFRKLNLSLRIPIIQRDYAQGRETAKEVRKAFLEALHQYLSDHQPHGLDFVYGATGHEDSRDFLPLDGQQRLTTLFLLHWFLAQITDCSESRDEFYDCLLDEQGHTRFSYETRPSARDFCEALLTETQEQALVQGEHPSLSQAIREQAWYFLSWDHDPTISAMLATLDDIAQLFANEHNGLTRLLDDTNPGIVFQFLDLKQFSLTDDLYIKMNDRGKQLTAFENLKSSIEQYLRHEVGDSAFADQFARKIDTEWADLLWHYRDSYDTSDDKFSNLLNVLLGYAYLIHTGDESKKLKELLEGPHSFARYKELGAISLKSLKFVALVLDRLTNGEQPLHRWILPTHQKYFDEDVAFEEILSSKPTYNELLIFFGYILYLIQLDGNRHNQEDTECIERLNDWMRLVYNLYNGDNTSIDTIDDYRSAFKGLHTLARKAQSVCDTIAHGDYKIPVVSQSQRAEEQRKAKLILEDRNTWLPRFIEAETHDYFRGQIGFLLEFSDEDIQTFDRYSALSQAIFAGGYAKRNREGYLLERAVLTKGYYFETWGTFGKANMLSTAEWGNIYRDDSWRRRLRIEEKDENKLTQKYFKELLDDPRLVVGKNVYPALKRIIAKDKRRLKGEGHQVRKALIDHPEIIEYAKEGVVEIVHFRGADYSTYRVLTKTHSASKQLELHTYALYLEQFEQKHYDPFEELEYTKTTSSIEIPRITCRWSYYGIVYNAHILCLAFINSPENTWIIRLERQDSKGRYNEKLVSKLTNAGYSMEDGVLETTRSSSNEIMEEFHNLCEILKDLKAKR